MKYRPKHYAAAFAAAALAATPKDGDALVARLMASVRRHGDSRALPKILAETERIMRAKTGRRSITLTTARPLPSARHTLGAFLKPGDIVETRIDPALVAGITITIDDTREFDGSLRHKLNRLFKD